jgi:predicted DNA-binding protein
VWRCINVLPNVILDNNTIGNTILPMDSLTTFSLRIPKELARSIALEAKRSGLSKSEYARRAMEEFNRQRMQERMAYLSTQLAAHSAAAHEGMESSISDGIV